MTQTLKYFILILFFIAGIKNFTAQNEYAKISIQFSLASGIPDIIGISAQFETPNQIVLEFGYSPFIKSYYARAGYDFFNHSKLSKKGNLVTSGIPIMIGYRYINLESMIGFEGHFINIYGSYRPTYWYQDNFGLTGQFGLGYLVGKTEDVSHEVKIRHLPDLKVGIGPSWK